MALSIDSLMKATRSTQSRITTTIQTNESTKLPPSNTTFKSSKPGTQFLRCVVICPGCWLLALEVCNVLRKETTATYSEWSQIMARQCQ